MRNRLKFIIGLVIGAAIFVWFLLRLNWPVVWRHLKAADPGLILAAAVLISLTYLVRSFRWRVLLLPLHSANWRNLFSANAIGYAAIFLFGRTGEVVRPVVASLREQISANATIATLVIERIFDSLMVIILFTAGVVWFNNSGVPPDSVRLINESKSTVAGLLAISVLLLLLLASSGRWIRPLVKRLLNGKSSWRCGLAKFFQSLEVGITALHNFRALIAVFGQTILVWALIATATYLTLLAFDIHLSVSQSLFVVGFEMVGSLIPTPGGAAGAFHTATAAGLVILGVEPNLAGGCAIVLHLVTFGPALIFGLFFIVRDGISLAAVRKLGAELTQQPARLQLND